MKSKLQNVASVKDEHGMNMLLARIVWTASHDLTHQQVGEMESAAMFLQAFGASAEHIVVWSKLETQQRRRDK